MVVPLLGILGAGLASQAGVAFARDRYDQFQQKRYGEQMSGLLGGLGDDADADEQVKAMAMGGLLSPQQYAQYGFGDHDSKRDFLEQLASQNQQYDLADRNNANSAERGLDMLPTELGIRDSFAERAEGRADERLDDKRHRDRMAGLEETASAIEQGLGAELSPLRGMDDRYKKAVGLGQQLYQSGSLNGFSRDWNSDPTTISRKAQLKEIEDGLFYDYVKKTRGVDTEPSPQELDRLRGSFQTFTDSAGEFINNQNRYDAVMDQYIGRVNDNAQLTNDALQRTQQRLNRLFNDADQPLPYPEAGLGHDAIGTPPAQTIDSGDSNIEWK